MTAGMALVDALLTRWTSDARHLDLEYAEPLDGLAAGIRYAFVGDYWQWDDDDLVDPPVGAEWLDRLEARIRETTETTVRDLVLPSVAADVADFLREDPPPKHLVAHVESDRLRADLALVG